MSILPITVYGDKILRQKTQQVSAVNDELIENIRDMLKQCATQGVWVWQEIKSD